MFENDADVITQFSKYLRYTKVCTSATSQGCWHDEDEWYNMAGDGLQSQWHAAFILNNGTLIKFDIGHPGYTCENNTECVLTVIDVNGFKGPNMIGKDIFSLIIYEGPNKPELLPPCDWGTCDETGGSGSGRLCGCFYLQE